MTGSVFFATFFAQTAVCRTMTFSDWDGVPQTVHSSVTTAASRRRKASSSGEESAAGKRRKLSPSGRFAADGASADDASEPAVAGSGAAAPAAALAMDTSGDDERDSNSLSAMDAASPPDSDDDVPPCKPVDPVRHSPQLYDVEKLLDRRRSRQESSGFDYLVKWDGLMSTTLGSQRSVGSSSAHACHQPL
jgi:hypothetical protein